MNEYEARQEERRERLERAADAAARRSERAYRSAKAISDAIPFGQPILIGHHSEKGDRARRRRMARSYDRSIEEANRAKELRARAAAVGTGGVSSDDPAAVVKLRETIAELEETRDAMKAFNAAWRKAGRPDLAERGSLAKVRELLPERFNREDVLKRALDIGINPFRSSRQAPFSGFPLTNLSANIRRYQGRIESLLTEHRRREQVSAALEAEGADGNGRVLAEGATQEGVRFTIREDFELNRVRIDLDGRIGRELFHRLRLQGWRWSRTESALLRHLNNSGRAAAQYAARTLKEE